jgi:hypothetical protein
MAAPRKRPLSTPTSGFGSESIEETSKVSVKDEEENIEEFLEFAAEETFALIELAEEKPEAKPFVEESIVPTEDPGLRFVAEPEPVKTVTPSVEVPKAPPKRHPRNTPKFSRTSK